MINGACYIGTRVTATTNTKATKEKFSKRNQKDFPSHFHFSKKTDKPCTDSFLHLFNNIPQQPRKAQFGEISDEHNGFLKAV